jgi:hypothetical protein
MKSRAAARAPGPATQPGQHKARGDEYATPDRGAGSEMHGTVGDTAAHL